MSKDEIIAVLNMMIQSSHLVQKRFNEISKADDFILSYHGTTLLDAISMRLQVVGESVKRIQKIDESILNLYNMVEWDKIAKFRDLVSHHLEVDRYSQFTKLKLKS
jgi:uncharacterized protein with HEPN domain